MNENAVTLEFHRAALTIAANAGYNNGFMMGVITVICVLAAFFAFWWLILRKHAEHDYVTKDDLKELSTLADRQARATRGLAEEVRRFVPPPRNP